MEIAGNIPFHVAQDYGVRTTGPLGHVGAAQGAHGASPIAKALPSDPPSGVERPAALDRIIAATVHRRIEFDGAASVSPHATLQLYTRAADKVEAAVAVNLGRAIDLTA